MRKATITRKTAELSPAAQALYEMVKSYQDSTA